MATKINDDSMFPEIGDRIIATAEFSGHAAATAHGPSRATRAACSPGTRAPRHGARGTARRRLRR
jgi:hypothetical protein